MKGGAPTNALRMSLKPATALGLDLFQLIKGAEDPIGKRLIGEWPQTLRGLEFWRMGWQKEQMEPFRNLKLGTLVPACLIDDQKNVLVWPLWWLLGTSVREIATLTSPLVEEEVMRVKSEGITPLSLTCNSLIFMKEKSILCLVFSSPSGNWSSSACTDSNDAS